jgi:hypothetical protein
MPDPIDQKATINGILTGNGRINGTSESSN